MTGIERLREFVAGISPITVVCGVTKTAYDREHMESVGVRLRDFLADIADQIERETIPREPGDGDVGPETLHAMALAQLDDWERDAIAWVREHGGIATVKEEWNHSRNLKRQFETAQAKVERQQRHIEFVQRKCRERQEHICELNKLKRAYVDALNGVCKRLGLTDGTGMPDMPEVIWTELDRRLMPEGMEWLVEAWPRFEDDAPLRLGERAMGFSHKSSFVVDHVTLFAGGEATVCAEADHDSGKVENFVRVFPGERVKRPTPKVLDADGAEIREGDTVYGFCGQQYEVTGLCEYEPSIVHAKTVGDGVAADELLALSGQLNSAQLDASKLTHRAPVLAADGKPLREGETVLVTMDEPHSAPLSRGDEVTVRFAPQATFVHVEDKTGCVWYVDSDQLTHERPDSWERLEEDVAGASCPDVYCANHRIDASDTSYEWAMARDIVRRARALAERDA